MLLIFICRLGIYIYKYYMIYVIYMQGFRNNLVYYNMEIDGLSSKVENKLYKWGIGNWKKG